MIKFLVILFIIKLYAWNIFKAYRTTGTRDLAGLYKKLENREPWPYKNLKTGTLKYKTQHRSGTGKAVPNVTLENLCNSKSTFISGLAQKATEFRKQNFKHFNFI